MKKVKEGQLLVCLGIPDTLDYRKHRGIFDYMIPAGTYEVESDEKKTFDKEAYSSIISERDLMYHLTNVGNGEKHLLPSLVCDKYLSLHIMKWTPNQ